MTGCPCFAVVLLTLVLAKPAICSFDEQVTSDKYFTVKFPKTTHQNLRNWGTNNSTRKDARLYRHERSLQVTVQRGGEDDIFVSFSNEGQVTTLVGDAIASASQVGGVMTAPYDIYVERRSFDKYTLRVLSGGVWRYETTVTYDTPWTWLSAASYSEGGNTPDAICEHLITRKSFALGETIHVHNFGASPRCGLVAISLCHDMEHRFCYVVSVFGFLTGKFKHTLTREFASEQGLNRLVPGRMILPPRQQHTETLQKGPLYIENAPPSYDEDGKIYNVYIEKPSFSRYIVSLESRRGKFSVTVKDHQWYWASVATYSGGGYDRGQVCENFLTRRRLEEGQTVPIYGVKATRRCDMLAVSLCEDEQHNACYVVDVNGLLSDNLKHKLVREFSFESGNRWIPGRAVLTNDRHKGGVPFQVEAGNAFPTVHITNPVPTVQMGNPVPTVQIGKPIPAVQMGNPVPTVQIGKPIPTAQTGSHAPSAQTGSAIPTVQIGNTNRIEHIPPKGSSVSNTQTASQACGIASPVGPLIAMGSPANLDILPWHVGIYLKPNNMHICGGTLVRSNLVISAAHCFHNSNDVLLEKSSFILAAGKLARSFKDVEPDEQVSGITSLVIAERYRGKSRRYEHDIAFVVVKFNLNSVVRPVCVDWSGRALPPLSEGDVGMVGGWGLTENDVYSESLMFARMPYIPLDRCERVVPKSFFPHITADKFCAGNVNGPTVKQGDSGGGLTFQNRGPGSQNGRQWYLRGVVSVGAYGELTYSAFVDVSNFLPTMRGKL